MKKLISGLIIILLPALLLAKKWNDFDKLFEEKSSKLDKHFETKSQELDDLFAKSLDEEWFNAKFKDAEKLFKKPKPVEKPVAPPEPEPPKPEPTPPVQIDIPVEEPVVEPVPVILPPPAKPEEDEFNIKFNYFDEEVLVPLPKKIVNTEKIGLNNKSIANYWRVTSSLNHEKTLTQLSEYQKSLLQNDWAYLMFIEMMTREIYPNDRNLQMCYTWFLLVKSGYQARVGYDEQNIYLLLPATTMIYGKTYFIFEGNKFYKLSTQYPGDKSGAIYTYPENYPNANKILDLKIKQWPKIKEDIKTRTLSFQYNGQKHEINVKYENNIIQFTKNFPQISIDGYAGAPLSKNSANTLLKEVARLVNGKSETEAVNILLAFVQKAFDYQTDQQQFGYEKWFFAEETINYPYSDCEDRSVLFSLLVRELLGLEVVLLNYPGHIATAVKFSKNVSGDKVNYNNKTYIVCDPTYIGASYGRAMPQFKNTKPKVIEI